MKKRDLFAVLGLLGAGSLLFASCIQRNYYNANPNNNYNHNHYTDSSYVYDEEFNGVDNYVWNFTDAADSAYAGVIDSGYQYVDYSSVKSNMTFVGTAVNIADNFSVITRIKSNNMMGLIFGASSTSNGYAFYVDTAGYYSLYEEGTGTTASIPVIPSTQDTLYALKKNWNVLEVDQANGVWTGYINGTQVFSMAARPLGGGSFGFKILPGTEGYAGYLKVNGYY